MADGYLSNSSEWRSPCLSSPLRERPDSLLPLSWGGREAGLATLPLPPSPAVEAVEALLWSTGLGLGEAVKAGGRREGRCPHLEGGRGEGEGGREGRGREPVKLPREDRLPLLLPLREEPGEGGGVGKS